MRKNIPIGAGLGGGSSDSATLLLGLRHFFNNNPNNNKISIKKLRELGLKIGSDVPACIVGKFTIKWNWKKLKKISIEKDNKFLLIYPNQALSTKKSLIILN